MVKLWKSKALACAAVVLLSAPVNAQNCSEILNHGIWRTWERGEHSTESSDFSNWACSNSSGDGGFAYSDAKANYDERSSDCSRSGGSYYLTKGTQEKLKTAAKEITSAWQACVSQAGSHVAMIYGADVNSFFLQFWHHPNDRFPDPQPATAKVQFRPAANVNCDLSAAEMQRGFKVVGGRIFSCNRNNDTQAINASVNLYYGGGVALTLNAVKPMKVIYQFDPQPEETDCGGPDIASLCSAGSTPINDSAHCNPNNVGLWAICFRQHIAPLPGMAGACAQAIVYGRPWCTYKNVATCDRYPGGTNSPAYRCVKKVVPE